MAASRATLLALMLAVATCLRSPAHGRAAPSLRSPAHGRAAPRSHRSRPSRPSRLPPPRAELNVFDEINEEARGSWLSRFLPGGERSESEVISEQPVLFTKMDAIGEPLFDYDRWAVHRSTDRYGRLVLGILFGKTTQRIAPVVAAVALFSTVVFSYNQVFLPMSQGISLYSAYPELQLPLTPFELTAPVLGLLLVFRTDTAYGRFDEGAQLAWEITASMRSLMRRLAAYTSPRASVGDLGDLGDRRMMTVQISDEEREAAADLIKACTMVHGWIMTSYLRGGAAAVAGAPVAELQAELLRTALGPADHDGEAVLGDDDTAPTPTPHLWISAITLGTSQRLPRLTDQERIALDDLLVTVAADLAKCEKLISTPIPLGYTRSSVRFLWIWITLLPFALSRTYSDFAEGTWWADKPLAELPVLLATMTFVSFIFLSIEDIAVQIEEPFAILPLEVQHNWLLRDAEQTRWLMRRAKRTPSLYDPPARSTADVTAD